MYNYLSFVGNEIYGIMNDHTVCLGLGWRSG